MAFGRLSFNIEESTENLRSEAISMVARKSATARLMKFESLIGARVPAPWSRQFILPLLLFGLVSVVTGQTTLLSETFEGSFPSDNGWTLGGTVKWDDVDSSFGGEGTHGGSWKGYCAGIGYGGTATSPQYQNNMSATMAKTINFSGYTSASLTFWYKIPSIESGGFDKLRVYVDSTMVWEKTTAQTLWTQTTISLTSYVGASHTVKFEFFSDGSNVAEGAYLDDILVTGTATQSTAVVSDAWFTNQVDSDSDGYPRSFRLNWDSNVSGGGSLTVFEDIYYKPSSSSTWTYILTTPTRAITGTTSSDAQYLDFDGISHGTYDWKIEVFRSGQGTPDYTREPANDADLNDHKEELATEDVAVVLTATISDAWFTNQVDTDGDGYPRSFRLNWDSNVVGGSGSLSVFENVYYKPSASSTWTYILTTPTRTITGTSTTDAQFLDFDGIDHGAYDWKIEVLRSGQSTPDYTREPANDADLNDHKEELATEDVAVVLTATISDAWFTNQLDSDADSYPHSFRLNWDANVAGGSGSLSVFEKIYYKESSSSTWNYVQTTATRTITGTSSADAQYLDIDGITHGTYDWKIEVYRSGQSTPDYAREPANDADLNDHKEETAAEDAGRLRIHGTMRYNDRNNIAKAIRYALVKVYDSGFIDREVVSTFTDVSGNYDVTVDNSESDGLDIYVRVYSQGVAGAYPGSTSAITTVQDDIFSSAYYLESVVTSNVTQGDITVNLTASNANGAFSVFDAVVEGFIKTRTLLSYQMPHITTWWPVSSSTYYNGLTGLHILQDDRWDRDVIMHEYGHYVADELNFATRSVGLDSRHTWGVDLRTYSSSRTDEQARSLAFREAWATYFSISSQFSDTNDAAYDDTDDVTIHDNLETVTAEHNSPGQFYEDMNTAALWDVFDNASAPADDNDTLNAGINMIWQVVSQDRPNDIAEFWNSWFSRHGASARAREITRVFLDHRMTFIAQKPSGPVPASGATGQPVSLSLDWDNTTNATSYDVYLGTSPSLGAAQFMSNVNVSAWTPPTLSSGTTYYWQIVAKDGRAEAEGSVWSFTTATLPSTSISPTAHTSPAGGETYSIAVTSNTNWTASSNQSWATVSPSSGSNNGTVTVTVAANATTTGRSATIAVGGQTHALTQNAAAASTTISPVAHTSPAAGETYSITVTSNTNWTAASNQTWATVSPASGSNSGTVSVTVVANSATSSRSATITIGGQTHSLTQNAAAASTTITPTAHTAPSVGETYSIAVTSNTNWTAASNQTWATLSPSSGSNNGTVSVTVAANTVTNSRSATITIGGQTHNLTQDGTSASTTISPTAHTAPAAGESYSITVTSNTNWTVTSNQAWATVSTSSGSGNGSVTVSVAANASTSSRSANITIGSQTHILTQSGASAATTISPTAHTAAATGESYSITVTSNTNWTVNSDQSWATLSPTTGSGNGSVAVTVAPNTASNSRTANITIGGQTHTLTQNGTSGIVFTAQPANQLVVGGSTVTFTIAATGSGTLSYRWYFTPTGSSTPQALNDITGRLAGTHAATLTVSNAQVRWTPSVGQLGRES